MFERLTKEAAGRTPAAGRSRKCAPSLPRIRRETISRALRLPPRAYLARFQGPHSTGPQGLKVRAPVLELSRRARLYLPPIASILDGQGRACVTLAELEAQLGGVSRWTVYRALADLGELLQVELSPPRGPGQSSVYRLELERKASHWTRQPEKWCSRFATPSPIEGSRGSQDPALQGSQVEEGGAPAPSSEPAELQEAEARPAVGPCPAPSQLEELPELEGPMAEAQARGVDVPELLQKFRWHYGPQGPQERSRASGPWWRGKLRGWLASERVASRELRAGPLLGLNTHPASAAFLERSEHARVCARAREWIDNIPPQARARWECEAWKTGHHFQTSAEALARIHFAAWVADRVSDEERREYVQDIARRRMTRFERSERRRSRVA